MGAGVALVLVIIVLISFVGARPAPSIAPPAVSGAPISASPAGVAVFVHVAGAVRRPGLYELPEGARVADAIAAAGGATRRAEIDLLNLAQVLTDGLKVEVPRKGEAAAVSSGAGAVQPSPGAPISLNSADQATLETVPGIGPVRAGAIIAYREEHGGFSSVDELLDVSGIGPATLAAIRELVTL